MALILSVLALCAVAAIWFFWRRGSRQRLLPCPASISWLVEMENPLARVTRSAAILRHLDPGTSDCIADIGCGPGRVTIPLARALSAGGEVIALDVQAEMLTKIAAKAEQNGLTNIRLLLCDAREPNLPDGSLDAAVMVMALGEIPDAKRVFPVIHAALREDGKLLVCESVFDPHYVSHKKVVEMAAAAGFVESSHQGNRFAYSVVLQKPSRLSGNLRRQHAARPEKLLSEPQHACGSQK
ncbi:MAG: Methyltransferase type 11 [Burkholderiaceae bacterium]|nr:Methyltransferase type 11 [Burkholderiaceae bacterium]